VPIGLASFDLAPEPLVLVPATVNDAGPFRFLLDTGSANVAVGEHIAEEAQVDLQDRGEGYSGVDGDHTYSNGCVRSVVVAGRRIEQVAVVVRPLDRVAETAGTVIDGILGFPFLRHFRLTIDYSASVISLVEEALSAPGQVPFNLRDGYAPVVMMPTYVDGAGPFQFVLDSGSSIMGVAERTARALALPLREERREGYGDPAEWPHWWTALERIAVGAAVGEQLDAIVYDMSRFEAAIGSPFDGVIGYPFLVGQGCVTIDYLGGSVLFGTGA
jgi:predicted aspartyl protease